MVTLNVKDQVIELTDVNGNVLTEEQMLGLKLTDPNALVRHEYTSNVISISGRSKPDCLKKFDKWKEETGFKFIGTPIYDYETDVQATILDWDRDIVNKQ